MVVAWHWLATVDQVGGPWLSLAATCLLVYHGAIALSASIPIGGELPLTTIGQWASKTVLAGCATVGMWVLVAALDGRDTAGNGLLTGVALAVVAGAAVIVRSRSLTERR